MKREWKILFNVVILVITFGLAGVAVAEAPEGWAVIQLTNNDYDDWRQQISGSNVVWHGAPECPYIECGEIFFWDGFVKKRLTDNSYADIFPKISGSNVVWEAKPPDDSDYEEIFFLDASVGGEPCRITNNSQLDMYLEISGSNVVWNSSDFDDLEIFFWDGTWPAVPIQITNDSSYWDTDPRISGTKVVWNKWDFYLEVGPEENPSAEIFFWDASIGGDPNRITNNSYSDCHPEISGSNVVWVGYPECNYGGCQEIFFWDGTMPPDPCRITDNSVSEIRPKISGSNIVWEGWDGSDFEIFFWDASVGGEPCQITDNSYYDQYPEISGSNVVWKQWDGGVDYELFFWDGTWPPEPIQLTDNNYNGSLISISGSNVAWLWHDGNDYEIFVALPCDSPALSDIDNDGVGDLCDVCPADKDDECDPEGSASRYITAEGGGTIQTPNGELTIEIEPNDISTDVTISVTQIDPQVQEVDIMISTNAGPSVGITVAAYDIKPDGMVFDNPVTVTFKVDVTTLNKTQREDLKLYRRDDKNNFVPLHSAYCSPVQEEPPGSGILIKTCTVELDHFSQYAMLIYSFGETGLIGAWGSDDYLQVSDAPAGNDFAVISAGGEHSLAIRNDGTLAGWGNNENNQCVVPDGNDFISIDAGYWHSLALKDDGSIVGWGLDDDGQVTIPFNPPSVYYIGIGAGGSHSIALKDDGTIVAWGEDSYGQVTNVPDGNDFIAVSAGMDHGLALKDDGSLVAWGRDDSGQVSNTPADPTYEYIAISAGWEHNLALRDDGLIEAWGNDDFEQVSDVPEGDVFEAISAGGYHCSGLREDGHIVNWGDDSGGQGTSPVSDNFIAVDAGGWHNLSIYRCPAALTADLNGDCYVTLADLVEFVMQWLKCANPVDPACSSFY